MPFYQGNADFGEIHPKARVWCTKPTKIAKSGDILLSVRAPIGALNIANEDCCIGRGLAAITADSNKCSKKYLWYALESKKDELISKGTGSTFKAISKNVLFDTEISYVPLDEQILIEQNLDKIAQLINNRKKQLDLLSNLVASRFIEMFGDPFVNNKRWKVQKIADVITEVRYGTSRPAVDGGKYPYLRMNNLTNDGHLDISNLKYIDIPDNEIDKCVVHKGDILFNRTNSIELVGKTAVFDLDEDMVIAGYIIRIRLKPCLLPEIVSQYMNLPPVKELLRSMAKGAVNQANINAQELQSIHIYVPDIKLQNKFVEFKHRIDKSKYLATLYMKLLKNERMMFCDQL